GRRYGPLCLEFSGLDRRAHRASAREGEVRQSEKLQRRIDTYLAELRRCLGELPPQEVHEILQEIRGHIFERAEETGELTEDRVVAILKALGRPDEIAPLYQVDSVIARR